MLELKKDTLIIEAIDAAHGDAILVRFYDPDAEHERLLLVDAGPKAATGPDGVKYVPYETRIVPRLTAIRKERDARALVDIRAGLPATVLDLVVCTHIDDDHIAGVDRLYDCLANGVKCAKDGGAIEAKRLWFNSFSSMMGTVDINDAVSETPEVIVQSVGQGETVTANAQKHGAAINQGAAGQLIAGLQDWPTQFAPAKMKVLSPDKKSLENLAKDWKKEMAKLKKAVASAQATGVFPPDRSVPNLSSIVMLVEAFGRKALLTGDQLSKNILPALRKSGLLKAGDTFHVDLMKVPHHGSIANVQQDFIDQVTADIYVFCANGKDWNPDPPVLKMIAAEAEKGRKFTMAFTTGDIAYPQNGKGKLPDIDGDVVKTLDEALDLLAAKFPKFKTNVTIVKRDPASHALAFGLGKGKNEIGGASHG